MGANHRLLTTISMRRSTLQTEETRFARPLHPCLRRDDNRGLRSVVAHVDPRFRGDDDVRQRSGDA